MKIKNIVIICVAGVMSACCGNARQSSCGHASAEKACCSKEEVAVCTADVKKIISAQIFIKPDKVDVFLASTKDLIEKSRAEEGCISYSLYQDPNDRTKFLFFEEWKNQAAIDYHFATEHFRKFGETLDECASAPPVVTIFDSIAETQG